MLVCCIVYCIDNFFVSFYSFFYYKFCYETFLHDIYASMLPLRLFDDPYTCAQPSQLLSPLDRLQYAEINRQDSAFIASYFASSNLAFGARLYRCLIHPQYCNPVYISLENKLSDKFTISIGLSSQ